MLNVMAPLFYQLHYCRWPEMSKELMLKLTLNQVIASINHHVSLGLLQMILASLVPMSSYFFVPLSISLCHTPDGGTSEKYKLLHFLKP
jgi:hypothetical protein